jgi:CSLREA domain-containing protein
MTSSKGVLLGTLAAIACAGSAQAATITVNSTGDTAAADAQCTLREAITAAESDAATGGCAAGSGADTISFSVTGTITVGSPLPTVTKDLTIDGPGAGNLTIGGGGSSRILTLNAGTIRVEDLRLAGGGGGVGSAAQNRAQTIFARVHVDQNRAPGSGVLYNEGVLQLIQSAVTGNTVDGGGGPLTTIGTGNTVLYNTTVTGNTSPGAPTVEATGTARLVIVGSTVAGNAGSAGVAFSLNQPNQGLLGSIVVNNAGPQCFRAAPNTGGSVSSDTSCGEGAPVGDAKLGTLGLYGGSTPVLPILEGSAAIGRFDGPVCTNTYAGGGVASEDQRGVARPQGAACDAGAFEYVAQTPDAPGGCGNGVDDDKDGFTDDKDPDCISGRGVEDRVDNSAIACANRDVVLTDVVRSGSRVRIFGLADPSLAGGVAEIVSGGKVVGTLPIGADGSFTGTVAAPSRAAARTARYQARLGSKVSSNLKLDRRLVITSLSRTGDRVVMRGRVAGTKGRRSTIELLARSGDCASGFARIGTARLARNGTFRLSAAAPKDVTIAIFRARVNAGGRTFSLPRPLKLR